MNKKNRNVPGKHVCTIVKQKNKKTFLVCMMIRTRNKEETMNERDNENVNKWDGSFSIYECG